jgi:hypothetical protein
MATRSDIAGTRRKGTVAVPALLAAASALLVGIPTAGLAVVATDVDAPRARVPMQFTPAGVDPAAARRVAAKIAARGQEMRFTPAGGLGAQRQTVTVAIRVDEPTARAISVRTAAASARAITASDAGKGPSIASIAPARYNLGIARGYRSFAKPVEAAAAPAGLGINSAALPDLASFRPSEGVKEKPSRLQGAIAFESESRAGRSPQTLEGAGGQAVDLSTGYRVTRNLNVTAGVRLTQDRDRLAPLTDGQRDDQAVYVGTKIRF